MSKLRRISFDYQETVGNNAAGIMYRHPSGEAFWGAPHVSLEKSMESNRSDICIPRLSHIIAILWYNQDARQRTVDLFLYSGIENWPGNPEVSSLVLAENAGEWYPNKDRIVTCGDGTIILGFEEELRRKTASLEQFLTAKREMQRLYERLGARYAQSP